MQTLEKALHQPMPFTTGGQTITDRLTAAKHSLAGSQLGKTICKATTEELMAPKKKHCDYLLHCTNEPNVSIPSMANLLIERTQNPNWIVVYKALITIHNLMCYGNERFSQYLASCNTTFNLTNFMDKTNIAGIMSPGYDMSVHVRRYGKYISEKIHTYRLCAFDFCKVKRGREDGLLRTMHTDKLLKTLPILQNQIDALLEFQVTSSELNNGVINCSFILLFRDLIRLFACYNDGVINLLEKFFDMNKKQCREALDMYKSFLFRLDKVSDFLRVAETVGIDRGEIPDLTRAPASLLEALEAHLYHLEGGKGPPPTSSAQQMVSQQIYQQQQPYNFGAPNTAGLDDLAKQRYLEEEKERLRQFEEQRRRQLQQQQQPPQSATNPFGTSNQTPNVSGPGNPDLLSFFDTPSQNAQGSNSIDPTNPFASFLSDASKSQAQSQATINPFANASGPISQPPTSQAGNPFATSQSFQGGTGGMYPSPALFGQNSGPPQLPPGSNAMRIYEQTPFSGGDGSYSTPSVLRHNMENPNNGSFGNTSWQAPANSNTFASNTSSNVDNTLSNLVNNMGISNAPQRPTNDRNFGPPQQGYQSMNQQSSPQWNAFGGGYNAPGGFPPGVPPLPTYNQVQSAPNYGMMTQQPTTSNAQYAPMHNPSLQQTPGKDSFPF